LGVIYTYPKQTENFGIFIIYL